ncbi:hypothetical protein PVAP13_5KG041601 [Panicum virgatum]|uniref:Uncharacterized protein n=1 Tax=Panicum virgatum TaxID=38727 RepID=A0A8T0SFA2_PANVG|nr:hypothetical protein PVAP13_5KG041601 [Panicum virgatum]
MPRSPPIQRRSQSRTTRERQSTETPGRRRARRPGTTGKVAAAAGARRGRRRKPRCGLPRIGERAGEPIPRERVEAEQPGPWEAAGPCDAGGRWLVAHAGAGREGRRATTDYSEQRGARVHPGTSLCRATAKPPPGHHRAAADPRPSRRRSAAAAPPWPSEGGGTAREEGHRPPRPDEAWSMEEGRRGRHGRRGREEGGGSAGEGSSSAPWQPPRRLRPPRRRARPHRPLAPAAAAQALVRRGEGRALAGEGAVERRKEAPATALPARRLPRRTQLAPPRPLCLTAATLSATGVGPPRRARSTASRRRARTALPWPPVDGESRRRHAGRPDVYSAGPDKLTRIGQRHRPGCAAARRPRSAARSCHSALPAAARVALPSPAREGEEGRR